MGSSTYGAVLLYFLVFSSWVHVQSEEEGHVTAEVSSKGLNFFVETLLMEQTETQLLPFLLPDIEKYVKIPLIGTAHMKSSNMTLFGFNVASSTATIGDTGILITLSDATANLSFNWEYSYKSQFFPISITDEGNASVQVDGMEIGLTVSLKNDQGTLELSVLECGCYVKDISIILEGGASWLYQGFIDAFQGLIPSTVEKTISKKIKEGTESFNSVIQSFPKEFPLSDVAALNITLIGEPELSDSTLKLAINGLFNAKDDMVVSKSHNEYLQDPLSCKNPTRMVKISMDERVLESAALKFFEADKMHWVVDKIPEESLLNTAEWKYIIPQLYKKYPDDQMNLNISVQSPPIIKIENAEVALTVPLDVIINVLDGGEVIPVVGISVVISTTASPEISSKAVSGTIKLKEFTMSLEWSEVGKLYVSLVESLISTVLRTVVLPFVNLRMNKGIPLPLIGGYGLQNTSIDYSDSWMAVCSDLAPVEMMQPLLVPDLHQVHDLFDSINPF